MESTSRSGSPLFVMRGHREAVNCVGFTSIGNKRCIVSGSGDGEVRIWDLSSRRPIVATHAHGSSVLQATSMCNGTRMLTQAKDGQVSLWDVSTLSQNPIGGENREKSPKPLHTFGTNAYGFCRMGVLESDGRQLVVTASPLQSRLLLWDLKSPKPIHSITLTPNSDAKTGSKSTFSSNLSKALNLGMCTHASLFVPPPSDPKFSKKSPENSEKTPGKLTENSPVVSWATESGHVGFYSVRAGSSLAVGYLEKQPLMCANVVPKPFGGLGIAGSANGHLVAFSGDFKKGQVVSHKTVKVSDKGLAEVHVREDSKIFLTAGWDHRIRVFSTKSLKLLAILKYHTESAFCANFSSAEDGLIASGSKDKSIAIFRVYQSRR